MLNSIIVLSENFSSFSRGWPPDPASRICPSLLVHGPDQQKLKEAYRYCSETKIKNFSLSISADGPLSEAFLRYIISFFFIPAYCTINNNRILNLVSADQDSLADTEKKILYFSQNQGIENIRFNALLPYEQAIGQPALLKKPAGLLFSRWEDLAMFYADALETGNLCHQLFFLYDPQVDITKLFTMIEATEEKLKDTNPVAYQLAASTCSLLTTNDLLEKKYLAARDELDNYKSHIEVMRSSHQAKELQDYYNYEYEILPPWYKRFGHIIKVLMGKRSFRSLFNDNVKKYKD